MSSESSRIDGFIKKFIKRESLISQGSLVLAAVSGGQDSMAMLSILNGLAGDLKFKLAVGHFDHKLREGSNRDRDFAKRAAEGMGLPFYAGEGDVAEIVKKSGDTIEEAARKARYSFLWSKTLEIGAERLATGHTRDDQVETVLMRILWGSGIRGLSGIPARRGMLIRPIIHLSRDDTARYCSEHRLPYAIDPSNQDKRFMRNKIRLELLPFLKKSFHPGVDENILSLCSNAQTLLASIKKTTVPILENALSKLSPETWTLDTKPLAELDDTSLFVLLSDVFADYLGCDLNFSQKHFRSLFDLCRKDGRSGKSLSLPGLSARREFDEIVFTVKTLGKNRTAEDRVDISGLKIMNKGLRVPGITRIEGLTIKAEVLNHSPDDGMKLAPFADSAYFSLDKVTPPLMIRTPVPGDRMRPFGMKGEKKLSDIFIDKKIPMRLRAGILVLSDAKEIMWLVGIATSECFRCTNKTNKLLKLTITRE